MGKYIIGIDIGGTNVRIGAVDEEKNVHYFEKMKQSGIFSGENGLDLLKGFIQAYLERHFLTDRIAAISIGIPGTVDKTCKKVMQAPNIKGFNNLDIVPPLEAYFHVPVTLMKDVWTAVFYDMYKYQIPAEGLVIGCYIGTGVGNVILMDGRIVKGKNGAAGELGHIPVKGEIQSCGCGNAGCIENIAAGKYLARLQQDVFPETNIGNVFSKYGNHPKILEFVENIAIAVSTEINILDPCYVLLGGGVLSMKDFPQDWLEERIHEHTRKPLPEKDLKLVFVEDDEMKGALGAALYAEGIAV